MRKSITPAGRSVRRVLANRAKTRNKNVTRARTSRRPAWHGYLDTARLAPSAAALLFGLLPGIAAADGARDWMNLPIDTNLVYLYYNHVQSNTQLDTTLPVQGVNATMNMALVTYFVHGIINNFLDTDKAAIPIWGFCAAFIALEIVLKRKTSL